MLDQHRMQLRHRRVNIEFVTGNLDNAYDYHLHNNYSSWMLLALMIKHLLSHSRKAWYVFFRIEVQSSSSGAASHDGETVMTLRNVSQWKFVH